MLNRVRELWGRLPRTGKVFVYLLVSALLAELVRDLQVFEGELWARYLLIPMNLLLVVFFKDVPELRAKLRK